MLSQFSTTWEKKNQSIFQKKPKYISKWSGRIRGRRLHQT